MHWYESVIDPTYVLKEHPFFVMTIISPMQLWKRLGSSRTSFGWRIA